MTELETTVEHPEHECSPGTARETGQGYDPAPEEEQGGTPAEQGGTPAEHDSPPADSWHDVTVNFSGRRIIRHSERRRRC